MTKVIIGFSRPKKRHILSSLIMAVERTNYSHVYIRFNSVTYDREMVYQASGMKVNFVGFSRFNESNVIIKEFEFDIPDNVYRHMIQFAIDNVGVPYGIKQLIGMGIRKFVRWLKLDWKNPWADNRQTYVCSELAAYVIKQYISESIGTDLDDMDPRTVYEYLVSIEDLQTTD